VMVGARIVTRRRAIPDVIGSAPLTISLISRAEEGRHVA
jgi:hypothetical protein